MFTHYRTKGFVLKKQDIGEADQVFSIFTWDFGRVEVLAKSIRKITSKLRSGIDLFYLSEIEFVQGKAYKILTDAVLIDKFPNLRQNLKGLAFAYKVAEIFDKLITGQEKDAKIWQLFNELFDKLNNLQPPTLNLQPLYRYFLWQLLIILGYDPEYISETSNISFEDYIKILNS